MRTQWAHGGTRQSSLWRRSSSEQEILLFIQCTSIILHSSLWFSGGTCPDSSLLSHCSPFQLFWPNFLPFMVPFFSFLEPSGAAERLSAGGNCIINCDRVIAWLSLQMSFLIFTNKQTHLNGVYFAFPVSWSRCILSSESCPRDTWDVHMHKIKDSFCCFRNPSKSHLRTFTDLKQCKRGSTDTWRNLTELLQSRGINRNKCQPLPPLHFVMSYLWIISFFVFFPLPIFWRGPVLVDQFYS